MCFSSGARPAGIVIPVCCRIIEYQGKRGGSRLCADGIKGSARKKRACSWRKLGSGWDLGLGIILVVTWDTTII